jgi:hypothetical protein
MTESDAAAALGCKLRLIYERMGHAGDHALVTMDAKELPRFVRVKRRRPPSDGQVTDTHIVPGAHERLV